MNSKARFILTCSSCGFEWELTPEEAIKDTFTCKECKTTFKIKKVRVLPSSKTQEQQNLEAFKCLGVGCLGWILEIWISTPLFYVHVREIRPMAWAGWSFVIALASFSFVVPTFIKFVKGSKYKLAMAVGLLLSVTTLPLSFALLKLASRICGFTLSG